MRDAFVWKKGFSLIELLAVMLMISVFSMMSVQLYHQYLIKTHRHIAKKALFQLASQLEHYYQVQGTYEGATWEKLNLFPRREMAFYEVKLMRLGRMDFVIQASPLGVQRADLECGTFGLDQAGRRSITGTGSIQTCWL